MSLEERVEKIEKELELMKNAASLKAALLKSNIEKTAIHLAKKIKQTP